jgi:quinol monooxygenase YgiN
MSSEVVTAIGVVRAKPGQEQELGLRMASLLAPTRAEPGCLAYDLFQSTEEPGVWVLIERWRSIADLEAHVRANHMTAFLARGGEVLEGQPNSFRLRPVSRSEETSQGAR